MGRNVAPARSARWASSPGVLASTSRTRLAHDSTVSVPSAMPNIAMPSATTTRPDAKRLSFASLRRRVSSRSGILSPLSTVSHGRSSAPAATSANASGWLEPRRVTSCLASVLS